jgi:tRNA(fMet)-specific endonuclease VapC
LLISDFDLLIGVTALIYKFILVTENTREFERIPKLKIENWIDRSK